MYPRYWTNFKIIDENYLINGPHSVLHLGLYCGWSWSDEGDASVPFIGSTKLRRWRADIQSITIKLLFCVSYSLSPHTPEQRKCGIHKYHFRNGTDFWRTQIPLATHTDDLGWYITSNQQGKLFVLNLNRIVRKPYVTPRQFPGCTTDSIPIDLMFQENFPTHTQVWNCLSHRNNCRQRGVIWVTYRCYNSNTYSKFGTSVIRWLSVPPRAWVGPTPTDRNQLLLRIQRPQLHWVTKEHNYFLLIEYGDFHHLNFKII